MKKHILIIDDEVDAVVPFEAFLAAEGHAVSLVHDYETAIQAFSKHSFDVVFTDILLGDKTGLDILREIKQQQKDCPVVMITGAPTIETAGEAIRLGAFDYLVKPVLRDTLLRTTNLALRQKDLHDENHRITQEKERYRRYLESILESVQDAIITVGCDLRVVHANQATAHVCGIAPTPRSAA